MTIKQKMLMSMIAAALICALAVFVTSIILFTGNINETAENRLEISMVLVEREINQMKSAAYRAATEVADCPYLSDAIVRGDREEVERLSIRLKNLTGVETLAIADTEALILARAHAPGNYGDSIANQFNIQSALAGVPVATIEIGTVVRFSVRGAHAIYDPGGTIVGAVTVGFRLDTLAIVDALKELTGGEVTFYMHDENVATTIRQPGGERAIGVPADERISEMVLAGQPYMGRTTISGQNARAKYVPLRDVSGNVLGMLFVGEYTAGDTAQIWFFAVSGAVATLIVIILSVVGSILVSGTIEKQLAAVVGTIKSAARQIDVLVGKLNNISSNLSDGSQQQAASVEETSAAMNETSAMLAQSTENTREAAKIASETEQSTTASERFMSELLEAMGELKESSDTAGKIVKTIDGISFQTNLLAINATVEAARAGGDAGRSFGVVAEEVRNLAQRSAKSAHETAEMIQKNIVLTNTSRESTDKMLQMAKNDAENVRRLSKLIAEIDAASAQQASGAQQISAAMTQIERSTQSNAAMASETASSVRILEQEAHALEQAAEEAYKLIVKSNQSNYLENIAAVTN